MPRALPPHLAALSRDASDRLAELLALIETGVELRADDPSLAAFGDSVARYVRGRGATSPGRSAASWIREQFKKASGPTQAPTCGRAPLRLLCDAAAAALPRVASALPTTDRGAQEEEVADRLGIALERLQEMLRSQAGRRAFWYPMHIGGGRFRWLRLWLTDPNVQAARASGEEPPHPVPLPIGYEWHGTET